MATEGTKGTEMNCPEPYVPSVAIHHVTFVESV